MFLVTHWAVAHWNCWDLSVYLSGWLKYSCSTFLISYFKNYITIYCFSLHWTAIKQGIETIVMIDIHYWWNIMSIIDDITLLYYKLKAMSYHAIIKIPVNPTATDLVLAYGATVAGNTKCLRKNPWFNIFFWHLSLFFLFWDIITSRVLEELRLASLQLRIWQYFLEVQHLWLCRLIMELQRSMLC